MKCYPMPKFQPPCYPCNSQVESIHPAPFGGPPNALNELLYHLPAALGFPQHNVVMPHKSLTCVMVLLCSQSPRYVPTPAFPGRSILFQGGYSTALPMLKVCKTLILNNIRRIFDPKCASDQKEKRGGMCGKMQQNTIFPTFGFDSALVMLYIHHAYSVVCRNEIQILKLKEKLFRIRAGILFYLALWIIILVCFFILCRVFPICSDDYLNYFVYGGGDTWIPEKVETFSDVLRSVFIYYHSWGGRLLAGIIFQTLLLVDKLVYDLLNVCCYLLLVLLICRFSKAFTLKVSVVIAITFWMVMPAPGSTLIWLTGSVNYLWMSVLVLFFLCCIFSKQKCVQILALPTALLAGNGHEGISSAILASLFVYLLLDRRRRGILFYLALFLFIVGFLINIMAPGTFVRMGTSDMGNQSVMCAIGASYLNFVLARTSFLNGGWLMWINFLWAPISFVFATWGESDRDTRKLVQGLSIGSVLSAVLVMFASGEGQQRTFFGAAFIGYLALTLVILPAINKLRSRLYSCILLVVAFVGATSYCKAYHQISTLSRYESDIRDLARKQSLVILPKVYRGSVGGRYTEMYGHGPDLLFQSSKAFAYYLSIPEVSVFSDEKQIQMVENSANFEGLKVGQFRKVGSSWYVLCLGGRPADVKGRMLQVPPPDRLTGFWGVVLNDTLRSRVSDKVGTVTFCREGIYYVQVSTLYDMEVSVQYVDGSVARYVLIVSGAVPDPVANCPKAGV